ncbi:hypothetical protein QBC37DRAFT_355404, partial [Rhypophila decipiens]
MEFAASLIAVVGLTDQVIRCCTRYISAVKYCPSDIRVLLIETSTLKSVIGNLEVLYKTNGGANSNPGLEQLFLGLGRNDGPIKGCRDCLTEIDKLLPDDWAQEDDDPGNVCKCRNPHWACISMVILCPHGLHHSFRYEQHAHSRPSHLIHGCCHVLLNIQETSRGKILDWLVATDTSSYHNTTHAMRDKHTGLWLDKSPEYRRWKNEQGTCSLIWFYGNPGAGKTVLFSHIVEDIRTHCKTMKKDGDLPSVCTYYYCYFGRNQDESLPLMRWIISQLARLVKYIPHELKDLYDYGHQPDSGTVLEVMRELSQRFKTVYIVVDGLDESQNRSNILRVMKSLRDGFPNLKILAMSREENDISEDMGSLCAQMVSLSNRHVDEDIAMYIRSELADNVRLSLYPTWLKQEIERGLVKGACGMQLWNLTSGITIYRFRWASCQIDVLSRLHTIPDIRQALSDLPRGLDATYKRILLSIPEEHKHRAKKALLLL